MVGAAATLAYFSFVATGFVRGFCLYNLKNEPPVVGAATADFVFPAEQAVFCLYNLRNEKGMKKESQESQSSPRTARLVRVVGAPFDGLHGEWPTFTGDLGSDQPNLLWLAPWKKSRETNPNMIF